MVFSNHISYNRKVVADNHLSAMKICGRHDVTQKFHVNNNLSVANTEARNFFHPEEAAKWF